MRLLSRGECIALLASGSEKRDLPSMLELKVIGRTVSWEALLAYFSRILSASPTTSRRCVSRCSAASDAKRRLVRALLHGGGVLAALQQSPTRDAAFFQLYPSLHRQLSFVSRRPANSGSESARPEPVLYCSRYVRDFCVFRYTYIAKRTTVGLT